MANYLKILFVLHYPPPIHGAAIVGEYIKVSELVNSTFSTKYINLSTSASVDDIGKQGISKWWRYLRIISSTFFHGLFWRPQLVYISLTSHGMGLWKDALIVAICRLLSLDHVFHFHNKGVKKYSHTNVGKLIYPFVFRKAKVILLSPLLYLDISDYVPESRVYYCANGIPAQIERNKTSERSNEKKEASIKTQILFLSNLIESKGVFILLEACSILQLKEIKFHCTFVGGLGDIDEQQFQEKVLEFALEKHVIYAGKKYGEEKALAFATSDIFVLPTYYNNECFPLVLLEAMQHSLPIVSTYEGAIPEIVDERINGFLVNQKDANSLAEKLEILISDKDLRVSMGKAGKEKYKKEYSLQIFENRLERILNSLLENS